MHIAIVGCGQLARMLALAGIPLGLKFSFIVNPDEQKDTACIDGFGAIACWQKGVAIGELYIALGRPDIVTIEKESVDLSLLTELEKYCKVYPSAKSVFYSQNRYHEKLLLKKLDITTADFKYGNSLESCAKSMGYPLVIKSISEGYDGKNQWRLKEYADITIINQQANIENCIVEKWVPYQFEFSIIAARSVNGQFVVYPPTENLHTNGVLVRSIVPASQLEQESIDIAIAYIKKIMRELDYVGVMAMECFFADGQVLVNELAPRVHNSGHWTQAASITSQFENHIRAIANFELGATRLTGSAGMLNLLGADVPPLEVLSSQTSLHWYNKLPRDGRKVGHINFVGDSREEVLADIGAVELLMNA